MITPQEIEQIIHASYPKAKVGISDEGEAPGYNGKVRRYSIITELFGVEIKFNLGENLIFLVEKAPMAALKSIPLLDEKIVRGYAAGWIANIHDYIGKREVPKVRQLSEKYIGKEKGVQVEARRVIVFFDMFHIIISPTLAGLYLTSTHRLVYQMNIENEKSLETFFSMVPAYERQIIAGQIR